MSTERILSFTNKLLQPELRPRVQEYVEERTTSGPVIVEFDPTTACNFSCPECINADLLNQGSFSSERLTQIINEFHRAGVKGIIFIGGGEPLAHKSMPEPIVLAHELSMSIGLTTNGSLINRYLDEIAKSVAWTRVSVDAATQNTFSTFRPSSIRNSFERVTENMRMLSRIKKGIMGYSFLIIERSLPESTVVTNSHEIYDAAVLARKIGCDYFEYKPMVDMHHNLIPFSEGVKKEILKQIPHLEKLHTSAFRVIAPQSVEHLMNGTMPEQPKDYKTCPTLEFRTVVTPKGIYPCPYKRGYEGIKIGDTAIPFDKYWKSDERRERASAVNPSVNCPFYCIRHNFNLLLHSLASTYEKGLDLLPYMVCQENNDIFI